MKTVAIHFDKDITLAEVQRAAQAIGCTLQVEIVRMPDFADIDSQETPPQSGIELKIEDAENIVFDFPSFLRRQAD